MKASDVREASELIDRMHDIDRVVDRAKYVAPPMELRPAPVAELQVGDRRDDNGEMVIEGGIGILLPLETALAILAAEREKAVARLGVLGVDATPDDD